tara:strand:- start:2076 stop:2378 length:303 start_codon:yes stop_codon:yes gene_type:complete
MSKKLLDEINETVTKVHSEGSIGAFRKLIKFIDAALGEACKVKDEERYKQLVNTILTIRDFLSTEILVQVSSQNTKNLLVEKITAQLQEESPAGEDPKKN